MATEEIRSSFELTIPGWVGSFLSKNEGPFSSPTSRMSLAIELSRMNVIQGTGGPFGAAVFESESGRLVSVGVNLVEDSCASLAHAEVVAITLAQKRLSTFDLGASRLPAHELVTSCEPCAMCFGAILWSGVRGVLCGARSEDAQRVGFDEGPKIPDWTASLEERGIRVRVDVLRESANAVFLEYEAKGGLIYNSRASE